jgi:transmembrane sensor
VGYLSLFRLLYVKFAMEKINKQYFIEIIKRYRLGKASEEEIKFLDSYYDMFDVQDEFLTDDNEADIKDKVKLSIDAKIGFQEESLKSTVIFKRLLRYASAAVVFLALSFGAISLIKKITHSDPSLAVQNDIAPGGNTAILTLANGKKIFLDKINKGEILQQAGLRIIKTSKGQIVYEITNQKILQDNKGEAKLNTISTPNGGQYQVVLPDGTKVWLNSASNLKYPNYFSGSERLVELEGEAYFEVTKNKQSPFRIKTTLQEIEVLGTHFNINAYKDEPVLKTTLLEGSVMVSSAKSKMILVPGQQARMDINTLETTTESKVDLDQIVAWKNGVFSFENEDLRSIMRQISRWYNVSVVFNGPLSEDKFFGEISRNSNLSQVIEILKLNNIRVTLSGKTISVSSSQTNSPNNN